MKRFVLSLIAAAVLLLILFEVDLNPRFQLPRSEERPDFGQEARYEACVEDYDRKISAATFDRVDNPDVQRELLYRQMQEAKEKCRNEFPERMVPVDLPLDINFVDLHWRY